MHPCFACCGVVCLFGGRRLASGVLGVCVGCVGCALGRSGGVGRSLRRVAVAALGLALSTERLEERGSERGLDATARR